MAGTRTCGRRRLTIGNPNALYVDTLMHQHRSAIVCFGRRFVVYRVAIDFDDHDDALMDDNEIRLNAAVIPSPANEHWQRSKVIPAAFNARYK